MYRVIDGAFWTDPRVRKLAGSGKLLFLYLITNTHTHVSGIYYLPRIVIAHETGIPADRLDTLCDTLSGAGLVRFDAENEIVWVVNMFRYQGKGEKNTIAASQHLKSLHESPLCQQFASSYPEVTKIKNGYKPHRVRIPYPAQGSQDQDQEQNQEQNTPPIPPKGDGGQNGVHPTFDKTPAGLATAWVFYLRRSRNRTKADDPADVRADFEEWIRLGANPATLLAEIVRPERDRSEHIWQFKKRMLGDDKAPKQPRSDDDFKRRVTGEA